MINLRKKEETMPMRRSSRRRRNINLSDLPVYSEGESEKEPEKEILELVKNPPRIFDPPIETIYSRRRWYFHFFCSYPIF